MDKNMKYVSQDIRSGLNPEENIPKMFHYLMNDYYTLASVRFCMHYDAFYEAFCDDEDTWGIESKELINEMNVIIRDAIINNKYGTELEETVKAVDVLRNKIMKKMKILTIYTDMFLIYEYILNRVEYRFKEETLEINEEEFEREVLRYIFDSKDNFLINEKIKEMLAQLPVRMTKQKFFDLLKNSFHVYLGADKSSLDSYLYMLKTSGLLLKEEDIEFLYPFLWEKNEYFSKLKFKDITKQEYEEATCALKVAAIALENETTIYFNMQEMINEIYTILLCAPYAGMVNDDMQKKVDASHTIISKINEYFIQYESVQLPKDFISLFNEMEGVQERISEEITLLEDSLYVVDKDLRGICESLMLEKQLNVLLCSGKLLSNSLFIDINQQGTDEKVDKLDLLNEADELINELSVSFKESDKAVTKAVMANILNKMPVFFHNHTEVMDYVRNSIEDCSDKYEKQACIHIIRKIIME